MIVYALIDPRDGTVRYVGKTHRTAQRRLRRHLAACFLRGDTHKERWIRTLLHLGLEPSIRILESCDSATDLAEAESFHIARLLQQGVRLTNATPGGDGGSGPHTPESKAKIRAALLGKPKTEEHRRRLAIVNRRRRASDATKALLRIRRREPRKPLTEARRLALSVAKGGRPFTDQYGNTYETQKGAARALGISDAHLNQVLHGHRNHVSGYRFRFLRVREFPC